MAALPSYRPGTGGTGSFRDVPGRVRLGVCRAELRASTGERAMIVLTTLAES